MRNNTWTKAGSHNWNQVKDLTITADTANPACQAVASAITTLMNILITNLGSTASPGTVAAFEAAVTETAPSGAYAGYTNSCVNQANAITSYMRIITDTLEDPQVALLQHISGQLLMYLVFFLLMLLWMEKLYVVLNTLIEINHLVDSLYLVILFGQLHQVQHMMLLDLMQVTSGSSLNRLVVYYKQVST